MVIVTKLVTCLLLAFALLAPRVAAAQVPPDLEAAIHLKVLSFDSRLKARLTKDTFVIAVVHGSDTASQAAAASIAKAFTTIVSEKRLRFHGKPIRAITVAFGADLAERVADAAALYVSAGSDAAQLATIARLAETRKLPTLCGSREYLASGIAIAVIAKNDKPAIVVHAANAKRAEMVLDSKLLRLAEILR